MPATTKSWPVWARPSLNWLLLAVPVTAYLEWTHGPAHWIFLTSAVAIIPVAGWMGHATEHLASKLGEGIGGLLNATFGNAAELIIAALALWEGTKHPERMQAMHELVKASLAGSILGNVLLVLGVSLLVGGLRHKVQRFNTTATRVSSTLMMLAVVALLVPDLFAHLVVDSKPELSSLSVQVSLVLLLAYALSLFFSLHTHRHLYAGGLEQTHEPGEAKEHWPIGKSLGVLCAATVGVGILAEFMIGSVHEASKSMGLGDMFVGLIVVAIVGNAAEHSTAVLVAWRNRMDLSIGIAVGSSIQIALFVAPVLVLTSHALGAPMDLVFSPLEMASVFLAVWVMAQISGDGESNWLEGVLLLLVYVVIAFMFYHLPDSAAASV